MFQHSDGVRRLGITSRTWLVVAFVAVAVAAIAMSVASRDGDTHPEAVAAMTGGDDMTASDGALTREATVTLTAMVNAYSSERGSEFVATVADTTRLTASAVTGMSPPINDRDTEQVTLVMLEGDFTLVDASVPPGAALPTGRYLSVLFSTKDPQSVLGIALSNDAPRMDRLEAYHEVHVSR